MDSSNIIDTVNSNFVELTMPEDINTELNTTNLNTPKLKLDKKTQLYDDIKRIKEQIASVSISPSNITEVKQDEEELDEEFVRLRDEKRTVFTDLIKLYDKQYKNEIKSTLHKKFKEIKFLDNLITKYENPKGPDRRTPINTIIVVAAESDEIEFKIYRSKFFNKSLFEFVKQEIDIITDYSNNINGIFLTREYNKENKCYTGRLFIKLSKDNEQESY